MDFFSFYDTKTKIDTVVHLKQRILKLAHRDFQEDILKKFYILLDSSFLKNFL